MTTAFLVPTPAGRGPSEPLQDLPEQLNKRLRLVEEMEVEETGAGQYSAINSVLAGLRAVREDRQRDVAGKVPAAAPDVEIWPSQTHFAMSDVVSCNHGTNGHCLECAGRSACNVPVAVYSAYCHAYQDVPHFTHPHPSEANSYRVPARSLVAGEIGFASFAALLQDAGVASSGGQRFLDLGSGTGRAVVAFALLLPSCTGAGIEIRPSLHDTATDVLKRLDKEVQQRVTLLCGDMFDCSWDEANVLLINSTGFDDTLMARVLEKLHRVHVGTKIITLSQPLPGPIGQDGGIAPPFGFKLLHHAKYRMTWGNATAYVYTRVHA
eukprot:TRINITY_DN7645_c0_g1_i1.p1 TRINITY_DN7645_c0_g1~~TRINITY_DN7645_c0_g1_i1.p1  ORF type:complete len:323 (+),score=53.14 TRINITY_DN7645_c0_g1_i1:103-1071(+)